MKALLFGGTFDPPHAGHMNNLRAAMQAVQPDVEFLKDCVCTGKRSVEKNDKTYYPEKQEE